MRLTGRRVLLTGASRGIGEGLAHGFRAAGAEVALVARASDRLDQVARDTGGRAYGCDLADTATLPDLVERVEADGPIDVLVNNAGVANVGWFGDLDLADLDQTVAVNLVAPMHLCHLVLPGMLDRGAGHIVNISSMAAVIAPPGLAAYAATKAGLSHFTAGLRADYRDDPIDFTTVQFASVKTDMDDEARSYGPLRQLAEQSKGRDVTAMADFVDGVVAAVAEGRDEVRFPPMLRPLMAVANASRVAGRLMFRSAPSKELRSER